MNKQYLYASAIYGTAVPSEQQAVNRVFDSPYLSGGEETIKFEEELAKWWGVEYAISTNSGSSANFIALQSLDLPKGSEVITPAGGAFPTTISPIIYHGLKPVFVDINLDTLCINIFELLNNLAFGDAIIFAHTLGNMPEMEKVMFHAKYFGLRVIEDCADAMGSKQNGRKAGTFGDLATVSFYPAHHMTTGGEGGAILTNNEQLAMKCRSIRDWGRACHCRVGYPAPACGNRFSNPPFDHRYYYTNLGMNLKLTEMQAAFGRVQLKQVDSWIELRRRNYNILARRLGMKECGELSPFAFSILSKKKTKVVEHLTKHNIHTRAIFSGNILEHPAYKNINCRIIGDLTNSKRVFNEGFFVGCHPGLSINDMNFIADKLKEVL